MDSDTQVAIKISDTGCGIPKSFRNALFQPFRQADSSLTRPKQGTGLGLSIVKHLVQRMSGTVDVESVEGEGSIFTVKLPITVPTNVPPKPTQPLTVTRRIKVVYVHERTAKLYVDLWRRHGIIASLTSPKSSLQELIQDADAIWTDIASVKLSRALQELMSPSVPAKYPPLFIVHGDAPELNSLDSQLSTAKGVILVKRPVIMNTLVDMLIDPEPHMGAHVVQSRVRFALPQGSTPVPTPVEEREEMFEQGVARLAPQSEGQPMDKVLLVEDNLVRQVILATYGINSAFQVNQHLCKRLLEKLGYEVVTAGNGQEAVEKVLQIPFLCIFMDCQVSMLWLYGMRQPSDKPSSLDAR